MQALHEKLNSVLGWDEKKLQFHQGYITALLEVYEDESFLKGEVK